MRNKIIYLSFLIGGATNALAVMSSTNVIPSDYFDLMNWKITLPLDKDGNGKVDEIEGVAMFYFAHPDYFFLNDKKELVFQVPNKAITTIGSSNARSELRQMLRGTNTDISVKAPANNFSLAAHPHLKEYGAIGGKLEATLRVEQVPTHAKHADKRPAYSVVIGQIHADGNHKVIEENNGFGYGNEPIKIFYKKWPTHKFGSVFWTYERNLAKDDPDRIDIAYPVWGNTWEKKQDPLDDGIALGEEFSYSINVVGNVMHLSFTAKDRKSVTYEVDLSNNIDAYGNIDNKDNKHGYSGDSLYFKAGAYGQCSVKDDEGFWSTGCAGSGNFEEDKKNGDYSRVVFSKLVLDTVEK